MLQQGISRVSVRLYSPLDHSLMHVSHHLRWQLRG